MSENVIFCFSGTGNCLDIARNIARELGDTDVVMMRRAPEITDVRGAGRVGFVFPCYGGGLPGGVEASIRSVRLDPAAYTFAVCSCAAYPGTGLSIVNGIYPLDYWAVISHQCSCIWLFPHTMMLPPLGADAAQNRAEREAKRVGRCVKARVKREKKPKANPVNAVESKAFAGMTAQKAKKFAVGALCIGCGTCAKACPRGNIRLADGKPQFGTDCLQCLACLQYCPQEAISLGAVTRKREHYHNPNVTADDLAKGVIHID
jgi:ferredoxin